MLQNPHVLLTLDKVHNPLRLPRETTSERPKMVRTPSVFNILTSKCASCHNGVHFFDISTSKSGPEAGVISTFWLRNVLRATTACIFSTSQLPKVVRKLVWFLHFDFEMCFAPQRRALFRHLNFQKWSGSWCDFYILTSKCASRHNGVHFFDISTSKRLRTGGVFSFFTFKCASRHNGVQFFISHPASWLRTRRFREPTFPPSGATNHWKNTVFRDFPTFSRTWIFFLLRLSLLWSSFFFSSLTLPISAFHLSILSVVWLLNFLR